MNLHASSHQERIWFVSRFEEDTLYQGAPVYYNLPLILKITGSVRKEVLEQAIRKVIERHEALRTTLVTLDEKPFQVLVEEIAFNLDYGWLPGLSEEEAVARLVDYTLEPFAFGEQPLLRGKLIEGEDGTFFLAVVFHHGIMDRPSLEIFLQEMLYCYKAISTSEEAQLPKTVMHYQDFVQWQADMPASFTKSQEVYWKRRLGGALAKLELPMNRPRPAVQVYKPGIQSFALPAATAQNLENTAQQFGVTPEAVMLSAFQLLLRAYSGSDEIVVGTFMDNRQQEELKGVMGPLANLVVLRSDFSGVGTFGQALEAAAATLREARQYQYLPFDQLVAQLNPGKDMSRTALFDVLFQYDDHLAASRQVDGIQVERIETNLGLGKYDLNLLVGRTGDSYSGRLLYNAEYYDAQMAAQLAERYNYLLGNLVDKPEVDLADIQLLTSAEEKQLLYGFNTTAASYPRELTLHAQFERIANQYGPKVAVRFGQQHLTYTQLNQAANRVAHTLRGSGVRRGDFVGVLAMRSLDMVVGLLGVLKAGGAYVPVDPNYPESRKKFMLEDSQVSTLITTASIDAAALFGGTVVTIDGEQVASAPSHDPEDVSLATDPAYLIYTSGTTGVPKGVVIEHRNVIRLLINDKSPYDFGSEDVWPLFHSYCFDVSVWEMYGALLFGGQLIVVPADTVKDPEHFLELLRQERVTVLNQTPSAFYTLSKVELASSVKGRLGLRYVIFAGENLTPFKLERWHACYPEVKLINMYGITETTVHTTFKQITREAIQANISYIGRPLPTATCYVFDKHRKLVPAGVPGEMYVGGAGVARGYWNRPELTQERFLPHPYIAGEKVYKSGDLVRQLPDGEFVFLGRLDKQVQIRGFRVELGEVEYQLLKYPGVTDVAVVAGSDQQGENYLCAYLLAAGSVQLTELKHQLAGILPDYMVPAYFVLLDRLPLTANGKLDVKSLPDPLEHRLRPETTYTPPRNETERRALTVWQDVLQTPDAGIDHNYFELGGNSLKAVTLLARIKRETGISFRLSQLFMHPTVRGLSDATVATGASASQVIPPLQKAPEGQLYYGVSSVQKRLLIINSFENVTTTYNIYRIYELQPGVDIERLEQAFVALIHRHEALRTSFDFIDNAPVQKIHTDFQFSIDRVSSSTDEVEVVARQCIRPFDLRTAPLCRVAYVEALGKQYLVIDLHHIVTDGVTMTIIEREINALYQGQQLPAPLFQYKDFSEWQNNLLQSGQLNQQRDYWLTKFSREVPLLELQTDFVRPPYMSFEGDLLRFQAGPAVFRGIKEQTARYNCTEYMVLLTAFYILLYKHTSQEDIVIGCTTAGRTRDEFNEITGCFLNMLPMRAHPSGGLSYQAFLEMVKQESIASFENQDYPFDLVVENIKTRRDVSRNPVFDLLFVFQNFADRSTDHQQLISQKYYNSKTSKYDLSLYAKMTDDEVHFEFEYYSRLFKPATISRMADQLLRVLQQITSTPDILLKDISLMSPAEHHHLAYTLNETATPYENETLLHQLFERQAAARPDNIALITQQGSITYQELNALANQVAHFLRDDKGLIANDLVGLYMARSIDSIAAMLGILKAGGAYVPLDTELPVERLAHILNHSSIGILITEPRLYNTVEALSAAVPGLHTCLCPGAVASAQPGHTGPRWYDAHHISSRPNHNPPAVASAADLAYIIHTSGTTGVPKGVAVSHAPAINLIEWVNKTFAVSETDRLLFVTSYSFDLSVYDLFGMLGAGASLYIASGEELQNPEMLVRLMIHQNITFWDSAPAVLQQLIGYLPQYQAECAASSVRLFFMSGDWVPVKLPGILKEYFPGSTVVSLGGATEATVWSNYFVVDQTGPDWKSIPYGKPIQNARYYILDEHGQVNPTGVPGNLYIGGECLAAGYYNSPQLTADKFIPDPFILGGRMYHTGDIARWMEDGNIEFLGRKDNQVKIRGYRIEKGEIESHLLRLEGVREVFVMDQMHKSGDKYLCAYLLSEVAYEVSQLRAYLSAKLPSYMIPAYFMRVEEFPLTPNGKVDKTAFPDPVKAQAQRVAAPKPKNNLEEVIASAWKLELGFDTFGLDENFFELGGNSLQLVNVASQLNQQLTQEVSVVSLFQYPTIESLAAFLAGENGPAISAPRNRTAEIAEGKNRMEKFSKRKTR